MAAIIIAVREAICVLHLRNSERGAITNDRKYRSLTERWFVRKNNNHSSDNQAQAKYIERNVHITLPIKDANNNLVTKDYMVLGIYTKYSRKWFPCEKGRQPWQPNLPNGKYRVQARMIELNQDKNAYQEVQPDFIWDAKSIYIVCDASYITEVHGKIRLDSVLSN